MKSNPNSHFTTSRRIVLLVLPPVRELDLVGIVDVFASANQLLPSERRYKIEIANADSAPHIEGMHGLQFTSGVPYQTLRGEIDTLLIPGGVGVETRQAKSTLLSWLTRRTKNTRRMGSICTGAFLLAQAGLLDGRRATTHWAFAKQLGERFPAVKVDPNPIWIRDENIYTSAGVTSGIDLCLALVEEDHGRQIALAVARTLVVFLCRPGNQAQFSISLSDQATERRPLNDLLIWMVEHPSEDLSIPQLATRAAMSERNFQRVFTREVGKSPKQYVEQLRIEAVRRKLERTKQSLDEIAFACGFGSADVMGRCFQRQMKITPAEYRARFGTSGI